MYKDILSDDELNALLKSDEIREEKESQHSLPPENASISMAEMKKTVDDLRLTVSRLVRRVDQLERELSELRDRRTAKPRSLGLGPPRASIGGTVAVPAEQAEMPRAGAPANISADSPDGIREASEADDGGHGSSFEKTQESGPDTPLGPRSQRHGKRRSSVNKLF